MTVVMKSVFSSNVRQIGYDADQSALYVQWHQGKMSVYSDVPPNVADETLNAPSIGTALRMSVIGKFPMRYV